MSELKKQLCPICHKKTLTLREEEKDIPYFGKCFLFSMSCDSCKYNKADIEATEKHEASKYTLEVSEEKDMKIRIIKSGNGTVKIPHVTTITPGPSSEGYITNVEGLLEKVKKPIEQLRDGAEDPKEKKKAKNLLKKLQRVMWGREKLKIIIEDPTGNSAIISDKAVKSKL